MGYRHGFGSDLTRWLVPLQVLDWADREVQVDRLVVDLVPEEVECL